MSTALFLILYFQGTVGGTFGPLPYAMEECERRRADMLRQIETGYAEGRGRPGTSRADWDAVCVHRDAAPALGSPR